MKEVLKERLKRKIIRMLIEQEDKNFVFNNWNVLSVDDPKDLKQLKQEFHVEQVLKGQKFWDDEERFLEAVANAETFEVSEQDDFDIQYRSGTRSKKDLLNLIRGYRSYPEFRNEQTVDAIYEGFKNNLPMDTPIVIEFKNGRRRVFSGNTRMDIAFQLGINPLVLMVKADR